MDSQPVVVITGASPGIGASLVAGYRRLGYAVVANSRNMTASDDPMDTMRWPKGIRRARGDIDDVVKAVLYLENSPFVTAEILHVDGGHSAGH